MTSEWKPIETAPKDGTPVLLVGGVCDSCDDYYRAVAWWEDDPNVWLTAFYDDGWGTVEYHDPTHWMPLPPPPGDE